MMKLIGKHQTFFDDEDLEIYEKRNWYISNGNKPYLVSSVDRLSFHREIMGLKKHDKRKIDHINHNTLDNRKCNLRIANNAENSRNRLKSTYMGKLTSSKYKGVCYLKREKRYVANIMVDYKAICLGFYLTEELAAQAYNDAAIKYHGDFACLNDIDWENY